MHDVIVVGIPLIAILAGILFARSDTRDLRGEMKNLRSEMQSEFRSVRNEIRDLRAENREQLNRIDADLRQIYHFDGFA